MTRVYALLAKELADLRDCGREVDRTEHEHARLGCVARHEDLQLVTTALTVAAVVQEAGRAGLEHADDIVSDRVVEAGATQIASPLSWPHDQMAAHMRRAAHDGRHGNRLIRID